MKYLQKLSVLIIFISLFYSCSKENILEAETSVTTYDFDAVIAEMPPKGFEIGELLASTNKGSLTYSILEQNPQGALSVDANSGKLFVEEPSLFVHELNPEITATAKVINEGVSGEIKITITVTEIINKKIYNGTINLRSQEELNNFGAEEYTHISGTLNIGKFLDSKISDIHDLSPLSTIEYLGKNLIIGLCPELQTLDGLDNLSHIGSILFISSNEKLTSLKNLKNIKGQYLTLFIEQNDVLEDLAGLEKLERMATIEIRENPSLKNIHALLGVNFAGKVIISKNPMIIDLTGLENLEYISMDLQIQHNESLKNLDALSGLKHTESTILINNNNSLIHIDGLRNLQKWPKSISILNNPLLRHINALSTIESSKTIKITENTALNNINGLANLKNVDILFIDDNPQLENIDPLSNLKAAGNLSISGNNLIPNISGLSNLETISHRLYIRNNSLITSLNGLEQLIYIADNLVIRNNVALIDFCALNPELIENGIQGDYDVRNNAYNPTKTDLINGNCRQ